MHMLVILESNWCLAPCTLAERNATRSRSSAIPKRSRKLNGMRNANSLHEAAELILRNQAIRTDEKFPGIIHVSHQLALLHGHENVFFCTQCGAVNAGGALRLLKSQCDGSGESGQKARRKLERGLMPNEHVMADAKRAFLCALFFLDVAGRFLPCIVNVTSHQKKACAWATTNQTALQIYVLLTPFATYLEQLQKNDV